MEKEQRMTLLEQRIKAMFQHMHAWNAAQLKHDLLNAQEEGMLVHIFADEAKDEDGVVWSYYVDYDIMTPEEYHNYLNGGGACNYYSPEIPLRILDNQKRREGK